MAPPQEALEMPDPSRMRINDDGYASPYQGNGQQGYGPRPYGSPKIAEARPSSAFGINPNIHSPTFGPGSPGYNRVPSAGPGPMGYRQGPGANSPKMQPGPVDAQGVPRLDIGYSAPMDRRRLQRPDAQGGGGMGRPQDMNAAIPRERMSRTPDGRSQTGLPPRNASMPTPNPGRPSPASTPRPGGPPGPSSAGAPTNGPAKASTAPAKPPGKGPKTFEEMGVPQAKHDSECVSLQ
jgi:hypothetical protein